MNQGDLLKTIITSSVAVLTALLPLIINYFGKRSKDTERKNLLDDSQARMNFLNNYYESLRKLLPDTEIDALKAKIAAELYDIKNKINESNLRHANTTSGVHFTFQKIFLTYKPATFMGWIWAILFYLDLFMLFVSLLGAAIDDAGNFTWSQFYNSIVNEEGGITAIVILIGSLLLFRWLALRNYKKNSHLQIPGHA